MAPGAQSTWTDVRTGTIRVAVATPGAGRTKTTLGDVRARTTAYPSGSTATDSIPVVVDEATSGPANRGGRILDSCTSGFTVVNVSTGQAGMTTAGHCPDTQDYYWFSGGGPFSTTFQGESHSGYADLQWMTTSAQPIEPIFHASPTDARYQTARGVGQVGQPVCHYGKTTGHSCTVVVAVDMLRPFLLCAADRVRANRSSL